MRFGLVFCRLAILEKKLGRKQPQYSQSIVSCSTDYSTLMTQVSTFYCHHPKTRQNKDCNYSLVHLDELLALLTNTYVLSLRLIHAYYMHAVHRQHIHCIWCQNQHYGCNEYTAQLLCCKSSCSRSPKTQSCIIQDVSFFNYPVRVYFLFNIQRTDF